MSNRKIPQFWTWVSMWKCLYYHFEIWQAARQQCCHEPMTSAKIPNDWKNLSTNLVPFNSSRPSDAIWWQWSWTTLAQVMACCLTAPSHYRNQCWLIIRGVLWHSSENSFAGIAQGINSGYEFEKHILKIIFKSPRCQWVKPGNILKEEISKWTPVFWHLKLWN